MSYWTRYPYKPRLGWGLFFGWASAATLSLRPIGLAIFARSTHFPRYQLTLGTVLLGYWIAGTVLGLVIAVAHPLTPSRFGAACLGFVLGWLAYAITGIAASGWDGQFLLFCLVPGFLVGGGPGVVFYDEEHPKLHRHELPT